jgi:hypothetical protein
MEINADAPVVGSDEIVISAPLLVVWTVQTDIAGWPAWRPGVESARLDGPLAVGTVFRRRTSGLDIASTIEELDPPRRIGWSGAAGGIAAIQVWTLHEHRGGAAVLVRTEESWEGVAVGARLQALLDDSLRTWLESLKREAERRAPTA